MSDTLSDNTSTTGSISVGGSYTGTIETNGDRDWLRITLTAGINYSFALNSSAVNGLPDPYLYLYDSTGRQITYNDDGGVVGYNSLLTYTPGTTGTYYLGVRDYGASTGNYILSASRNDDYANTSITTGRVPATGLATSGRIENSADADWFSVTLTAGTTYQLRANAAATSGLSDPFLNLYNSAGTLLLADDDSGNGNNSLITYTPTSTGTYFLGVKGFGSSIGNYTVSATPQVTDDFLATTTTTGRVTVNAAAVSGQIGIAGDHDWFSVTLAAGVDYQLRLNQTATNGLGDPYLRLLNASGAQLANNDDGGSGLNSLIAFTPTSTGTYYLEAGNFADNNIGNYTISASAVDDFTGNMATTANLTVNGSPMTGRIEVANDKDWFRVTLNAGVTYDLRLNQATNGLGDPVLNLLDGAGRQLVTNDDSGGGVNALIRYTPTTTGTYYLEARDFGQGAGLYSISAAVTSDDFAATTATTGTVSGNGSVAGTVNFSGDQDWFRIAMTAGATYTVHLLGTPSGGGRTLADPFLRGIYDSTGALLPSTGNDDYGSSRESQVTFTAPSSGNYYIAAGAYWTNTGTYQLTVTSQTAPDILGSTSSLVTITAGGRQSSTINSAGDQDWFRTTLTAGTPYVIDLVSDPSSNQPVGDPYFRGIYNSRGALIPNTSNDDYGIGFDSRMTFTPSASGTYFLAAGAYGGQIGGYRISLTPLASQNDAVGNATTTAGSVPLGPAGINGQVDFARDVDWYGVSLTAGQTYEFNLGGADSGQGTLLDPRLVGIYTGAGALISGTGVDDSMGASDVQTVFRPTTTGTYYFAVSGENDLIGSYHLSVEQVAASLDIPANMTTQSTLAIGGTLNSQIDVANDADWVRVSLTAGQSYTVRMAGAPTNNGTLADPLIGGIFNAMGQVIPNSGNDDFGGSRNSQVTFTAPSSGNYYISAEAFDNYTGTYRLSIAPGAAPDATVPTLNFFSPSDGSTAVSVASNLTFNFNEIVRAGSGDIVISGGGQSLHIPVTSSQVTFSGSTMTVNPTSNLAYNSAYTVTMGSGVVDDIAGNHFVGLANSTQFNFSTATNVPLDEWTVIVYIAGDNNLETFGLNDINEMESVTLPSNVNVVVQYDRAAGYDTSHGNWTDTRRGVITHDTNLSTVTSNLTSIGEQNTGDPTVLTNFINWATTNNPAHKYALVVWDHGGGLSGSCWDDASGGDHLSSTELRTAIDNATANMDLIGFDACLMSMMENTWDLRGLAGVVVASEETIPGEGWAYDRWLGQLAANSGMSTFDLGRSIVTTYGQEYAGQSDITLSAVQTNALADLDNALDLFVASALALPTNNTDWTAMRTAASHTEDFDSNRRDLGDFMEEVAVRVTNTTLRARANNVIAALDTAVFSETGTVGEATGMSIYLPYGSTPVSSSYTAANHPLLGVSTWDDFLNVI